MSRCKVFVLHELTVSDLCELLKRAIKDERGFGNLDVEISDELIEVIANFANGDARSALSTLEMAVLNGVQDGAKITVTSETIEQCTSKNLYCMTRRERSITI